MMQSLRWKLILMAAAIVVIPIYFLNQQAIRSFDLYTRTALEEEMKGNANMVGAAFLAYLRAEETEKSILAPALDNTLSSFKEYGKDFDARLLLLDSQGIAMFDTLEPPEKGKDFSDEKAIVEVHEKGFGAAWSTTGDNKFTYYYIAVPIGKPGSPEGIAYIIQHTNPIIGAILQLKSNQTRATAAALLIALFTSILIAFTLIHPLRRLTQATHDFARGEPNVKIPVRGKDEIGRLGQSIDRMVEEIEKRNTYNRDFVTTLAHELRTPLTAIKGATEILEESENLPLEKREKFQANIRIETERVIRMVNELGELTRLDAETLRTERETVDYPVFIRQVLEKLEPAFDQPHAKLITEIPEEIIVVHILPARIEQVFANLLENAFRYTPSEGKVTLRVQTSPDGQVRTEVEDTGCGIDPVNLAKVFDRFFTTEPKGQPRDHGSGLGLSIVRSIIENHGGTIRAKNIPDGGTRFTFTLT